MTIDLTVALAIASTIASIAFAFGYTKNQVHQLWKAVTDIKNWKERHEEISTDKRSVYDKELSNLASILMVRDEQYREIIRRLESIEKKI